MASQLQLLENGRPLGPGHALHQTIRDVGQGTFSHWIGHLYFSTSDGTDPRTNGRHYTIRVTAEVVPWVLWGLATGNAVALGFGANWLRRRLGAARWAWFRRGIVAILQLILLVLLTGGMILQFGVWTQTQSLPEPFVHYDGHAYTFGFRADIAWPWVFYTPTSDPTGIRSQLDFFENDHALTRQNTAEAIIAQGNGVYSHWGDQLYFASSDNSNPNTNGFSYRVEYPVLMRGCILFGLFVILIFLIWWKRFAPGLAQERVSSRRLASQLASGGIKLGNTTYWIIFGVILCIGTVLRIFWTWFYQVPFMTPDSLSYLYPIISSPWLPFSEVRTIGYPLVIAAGAAIFEHPVGSLITFNILSLTSSVCLALAIRKRLKLNVLSLIVLAYLTLSPKNLSFEYFFMSEHVSRILYVLFAAATLYLASWVTYPSFALGLGLLVLCNILIKPSALVLIAFTTLSFLYCWLYFHRLRARILCMAGLALTVAVGGTATYAAMFKMRYGAFSLSQFEGYNLFCHVGHLVDLDSENLSDLKKDLRPLIESYRKNYVSVGDYQCNWLVHGSLNDQLRRDLGTTTPAGVVSEYAARRYGKNDIETRNRIFFALASEGIAAHPLEYLSFAFDRLIFFAKGYGFVYGDYLPTVDRIDLHLLSRQQQQQVLLGAIGQTAPAVCPASVAVPADAPWFVRASLRGVLLPCSSAPYDNLAYRKMARKVTGTYVSNISLFASWLQYLPLITLCALPVFFHPRMWGHRARQLLGYSVVFAMLSLSYGVFLALFNVSEAPRFIANIQDIIVLSMTLFLSAGLLILRRTILAWWLRRLPKC